MYNDQRQEGFIYIIESTKPAFPAKLSDLTRGQPSYETRTFPHGCVVRRDGAAGVVAVTAVVRALIKNSTLDVKCFRRAVVGFVHQAVRDLVVHCKWIYARDGVVV